MSLIEWIYCPVWFAQYAIKHYGEHNSATYFRSINDFCMHTDSVVSIDKRSMQTSEEDFLIIKLKYPGVVLEKVYEES